MVKAEKLVIIFLTFILNAYFCIMKSQFLISAPSSGSGKTTISRGLMALLAQQGYMVQPFKCGPDYIDTKFHEAVCGRPSINLDSFMATPQHVQELYIHYDGVVRWLRLRPGLVGRYSQHIGITCSYGS